MTSQPLPLPDLELWSDKFVCPVDRTPLKRNSQGLWSCSTCSFATLIIENNHRRIHDFRAVNIPQSVTINFKVPVTPLDRYEIARKHFRAPKQPTPKSTVKIATKLDQGCQYYLRQILEKQGPDISILDLGCGNGDNRRFMQSIGFRHVLSVDWQSKGAELLADAHRLPLASNSFQVVVSTAVLEHLYNPYIAMAEVGRILTDDGCFLGGASFWEAWHGSSYFHFTPDGWNTLLEQNDLHLEDLWIGWGIIPAAITHVFVPGHFRSAGYRLQRVVEQVYKLWGGEMAVRKFQLRASGSYMIYAIRSKSETGATNDGSA